MGTKQIRQLTGGGLMLALVLVATYSIKIPIPFTQGYIHGGDSMIFVAAMLFGWKIGALAGGIGSSLADVLGGYAHWALPTLLIKSIMGALAGWIGKDLRDKKSKYSGFLLSMTMAGAWFGFALALKAVLGTLINARAVDLAGQIEGTTTASEVVLLSQKLEGQLLWLAIVVPIIVVLLSIYLRKQDQELFAAYRLLGMLLAGLWMVGGYYVAGGIMYGSFIVPIFSIPWNMVQFVIGLIIAYFVIIALQKTPISTFLE
jgi:uncharacterized membrane protein